MEQYAKARKIGERIYTLVQEGGIVKRSQEIEGVIETLPDNQIIVNLEGLASLPVIEDAFNRLTETFKPAEETDVEKIRRSFREKETALCKAMTDYGEFLREHKLSNHFYMLSHKFSKGISETSEESRAILDERSSKSKN